MVAVTLEIPDEVHERLLAETGNLGLGLEQYLVNRLLPPTLVEPDGPAAGQSPEDPLGAIQEAYDGTLPTFQHRMMELQLNMLELQRQVVQRSLETVRDMGLNGAHHFYLAFRTQAPGVELGDSLRASNPETMTIVLEKQFSSLEVDDDRFSVSLWFGGVPRRIGIPFDALIAFLDPSTQFQLSFPDLHLAHEAMDDGNEEEAESADAPPQSADGPVAANPPAAAPAAAPSPKPQAAASEKPAKSKPSRRSPGTQPPADTPENKSQEQESSADDNVISFADFRKK